MAGGHGGPPYKNIRIPVFPFVFVGVALRGHPLVDPVRDYTVMQVCRMPETQNYLR